MNDPATPFEFNVGGPFSTPDDGMATIFVGLFGRLAKALVLAQSDWGLWYAVSSDRESLRLPVSGDDVSVQQHLKEGIPSPQT